MKSSKLARVIALGSIFSTAAYATLTAPEDVSGYNHLWGASVVDGIEQVQQLADKTNILANGNADRINALANEPKPMDGKNGLDGTNGTNGKDGADGKDGQNGANGKDGAAGAAGLNGTDHHNDVVVQKNTDAVSQNTQRLSHQEARIRALASQDNSEFANLKAEVDNNQSRSDAGIAGVAVGASFHATQNTIVKLTVSNDTQHNFGWGAGTSYGW